VLIWKGQATSKRKPHVLVVERERFKVRARLFKRLKVSGNKGTPQRGGLIEGRRWCLERRDIWEYRRDELRKNIWPEYGRRYEEVDCEKEWKNMTSLYTPCSFRSPIARQAQDNRSPRSCHDSSISSGGMWGAGLFAQAPGGYIAPTRRRIVMGASAVLSAFWTGSFVTNDYKHI
jgi:hypothetical protein